MESTRNGEWSVQTCTTGRGKVHPGVAEEGGSIRTSVAGARALDRVGRESALQPREAASLAVVSAVATCSVVRWMSCGPSPDSEAMAGRKAVRDSVSEVTIGRRVPI